MIDLKLKELLTIELGYRYGLLDRMSEDCKYYLKKTQRKKDLWVGDEAKQIRYMKVLFNSFPENKKPEWLSYEDILEYEKSFKEVLRDPNHEDYMYKPFDYFAENNNVYIKVPYYTPVDEMDWGDGKSIEMEERPLYFDGENGNTYLVIDEWWDKFKAYEYPNYYHYDTDVYFCIGKDIYGIRNKDGYSVIVNGFYKDITPHKEFEYDHQPTREGAFNSYGMYFCDLRREFEDNLKKYDETFGKEKKQENNKEREL